jgi:hypothetical protein
MRVETVHETVVLHLPEEGPRLGTGQDALDVIGEAWAAEAQLVAVPAGRFRPAFFDLRSGLAGEFLQKLVNYHLRLAVLGDISAHVAASDALRDFVRESNRGRHVWFVEDTHGLAGRLVTAPPAPGR